MPVNKGEMRTCWAATSGDTHKATKAATIAARCGVVCMVRALTCKPQHRTVSSGPSTGRTVDVRVTWLLHALLRPPGGTMAVARRTAWLRKSALCALALLLLVAAPVARAEEEEDVDLGHVLSLTDSNFDAAVKAEALMVRFA